MATRRAGGAPRRQRRAVAQAELGSGVTGVIHHQNSAARIDDSFVCTSFAVADWDVLGPTGMSIRFPTEAWQLVDMTDTSARGRCAQHALTLEATWRLESDGVRLDLLVVNQTRAHAPFGI